MMVVEGGDDSGGRDGSGGCSGGGLVVCGPDDYGGCGVVMGRGGDS